MQRNPFAKKRSGPRFAIIPAGAVVDSRLDGNALRVLCLLGRHTNDNGWCRRSQTTMAEELGVSRATVQRALSLLCESGYVLKKLGDRPNVKADPEKQPFAAYWYCVRLDPEDAADETADGSRTADANAGEHGGVPTGEHGGVPTGEHGVPNMHEHPIDERSPCERLSLGEGLSEQGATGDRDGLKARVAKLSRALGDDVFKAWFEEACFEDGSPVTIIFPRPFQVNWVRNHFASTIARIFGDDTKVEVLGKRELPPGPNQTATAIPASASGGASDPWWNKEAGDGAEAA